VRHETARARPTENKTTKDKQNNNLNQKPTLQTFDKNDIKDKTDKT
jgi:hypothetical protein